MTYHRRLREAGRSPGNTRPIATAFCAEEDAMRRLSNFVVLALMAASPVLASRSAAAQTYLLEVQAGGPGTVSPGTVQVPAGGSQAFTFKPDVGNVAYVTVDDVHVGSGLTHYTFTNVQSDHILYVSFGPPPPPPPPLDPTTLFSPPHQSYGTGASPYSVAIADFNADGQSDLVTANAGSNSVSVLLGYGGGGFGSQTFFPTGNSP